MPAFDYRQMARDYVAEAEASEDAERRVVLLGIAKLYHQTALAMEAAEAAPFTEQEKLHAFGK